MSRGLSTLQNRILGLACAVNRFTCYGDCKVKTGPEVKCLSKWRRVIEYPGVADINYTLAVHWLYEIPFVDSRDVERIQTLRCGTKETQRYTLRLQSLDRRGFGDTPAAVVKRSFKSLVERGLLVQTDGWHFFANPAGREETWGHYYYWGSVLTDQGMAIAQRFEESPADLVAMIEHLRWGHYVKSFHIREVLANPAINAECNRLNRIYLENRGLKVDL